ncbi:MAG: TraR/DksA C4-type zinc finger protein [Actinobacteria bacterium]|nr:TraR/DksA C4-type zinc finger protein [Actinomycetota bacterium]MBW3650699.1 TraR/DksA C4-type zinc finger protein [Actinomycetota bacterium]
MPKASKAAPSRKKAAPKSAAAVKAAPEPKKATPPAKRAKKDQPAKAAAGQAAPAKAAAQVAKQPPAKAGAAKKPPASTKKATAKKASPPAAAKKTAAAGVATPVPKAGGAGSGGTAAVAPVAKTAPSDPKFLDEQRALLLAERRAYEEQATALKAEADQLAAEMEPGDVQFDEESGEGDSIGMERERDLQLAGQARAAIEEIDRALAKAEAGTYGLCERCGQPIPKARLKALPYAALCVACKSGGLTSRR